MKIMRKKVIFTNKLFSFIGDLADSVGVPVYVVGGYVRDRLLGKTGKDIDFVVIGDGPAFARDRKSTRLNSSHRT